MLGNRNSSFRFFEPFFSDCDLLFAGFETLIERVWVQEEIILAQEVQQMVLANGTVGSCSVVQHSGGGQGSNGVVGSSWWQIHARWLQRATKNSLVGWRRSRVQLRVNEPVLHLCPASGGYVTGEGQQLLERKVMHCCPFHPYLMQGKPFQMQTQGLRSRKDCHLEKSVFMTRDTQSPLIITSVYRYSAEDCDIPC